jgi:hypothetical protein
VDKHLYGQQHIVRHQVPLEQEVLAGARARKEAHHAPRPRARARARAAQRAPKYCRVAVGVARARGIERAAALQPRRPRPALLPRRGVPEQLPGGASRAAVVVFRRETLLLHGGQQPKDLGPPGLDNLALKTLPHRGPGPHPSAQRRGTPPRERPCGLLRLSHLQRAEAAARHPPSRARRGRLRGVRSRLFVRRGRERVEVAPEEKAGARVE